MNILAISTGIQSQTSYVIMVAWSHGSLVKSNTLQVAQIPV